MDQQEAYCGLKVGDTKNPHEPPDSRFRCDAVGWVPASGLHFLEELGFPLEERTQVVDIIYGYRCDQLVEQRSCPADQAGLAF